MAGKRKICLISSLLLASILLYNTLRWSLMDDHDILLSSGNNSRRVAEDTLQAARDSVRDAMQSLLHDGLGSSFKRSRLGASFERFQVSLDSRRHGISGKVPASSSVHGHHVKELHQVDICASFAGKRITMIGGEHVYRLHLLLLQERERAERKPFACRYHEFCTHHRICLPSEQSRDDTPPPRYIKPPTTQELIDTESATVSYVVSDTLVSAPNESSWEYTRPFLDPTTGVRLRETYWFAAARKANVVIVGRGPLSAPYQTYTGNWSFVRHVPDYVGKSRIIAESNRDHDDDVHMYRTAPRSLDILNAAVHLTVSRFLPELFQLLHTLDREGIRTSKRKRLIWPSSWYRLPGRGAARALLLHPCGGSRVRNWIRRAFFQQHSVGTLAEHVLALQLSAFIRTDLTDASSLEDPWTLLFNIQVYLQNVVLRVLLPRYGIVFLPLNAPWVVDAESCGLARRGPHDDVMDIDRARTAAIGEAFLTGMDYALRYLG